MTTTSDYANFMIKLEVMLKQMVSDGVADQQLREKAAEILAQQTWSALTIPHAQRIDHPIYGVSLRFQLMNGQPHPIAIAWVPVTRS